MNHLAKQYRQGSFWSRLVIAAQRLRIRLSIPLAGALLCGTGLLGLTAVAEEIPFAEDFTIDGQISRQQQRPIVALITAESCHYCEAVKQEVFQFMTDDPRIILRELDLESSARVVGFNGAKMSQSKFAYLNKATFTPTVLFLGPNGEMLAEPLVGVATMDYYPVYLQRRIEAARRLMTRG